MEKFEKTGEDPIEGLKEKIAELGNRQEFLLMSQEHLEERKNHNLSVCYKGGSYNIPLYPLTHEEIKMLVEFNVKRVRTLTNELSVLTNTD